jgi:hypothetical protein
MQPSKSVSDELRDAHHTARKQHHHRQTGGRSVGGEGRRRIAGARAGDGANLQRAAAETVVDHADQHRHPEILERPGVRGAALLHEELAEAELGGEATRRIERRHSFAGRDDRVVRNLRRHPFALAPYAGEGRRRPAGVEARAPGLAAGGAERVEVVGDLEQPVAGRAAVNGLREREAPGAAFEAAEVRAGLRHHGLGTQRR